MPIDDAAYFDEGDALRDSETPENRFFGEELAGIVKQTLDRLPEELKMALVLREFDGLSYEEIAEVMECPVGTVRSRIFRAREALDVSISAQMRGE
jgi:RNA polymerase sigma-70 factor (ECF subfamily)